MEEISNERRVAFVSGHSGGSIGDVALTVSLFCACVLLRNLALPWFFPAKVWSSGRLKDATLKFCLDFALCIAPIVVGLTVLADQLHWLLTIVMLINCTLLALAGVEYCWLYRETIPITQVLHESVHNPRPVFVSYFRSLTLVISTFVILAVDFPLFPRRYAKTEMWGYSLMDFGVGGYCVINGFCAPELRNEITHTPDKLTLKARLKTALPLLCIGLARLVAVKFIGYHEHITEYGLYWNFFLTLAAVKAIVSLIGSVLDVRKYCLPLALTIISVYQFFLTYGGGEHMVEYGLYGDDSRADIIDANREGLFSLAGFIAIYLLGIRLHVFTMRARRQLYEWIVVLVKAIIYFAIGYIITVMLHERFGIYASRRMANVTYVAFTLSMCLLIGVELVAIEVMAMIGCALRAPLFSLCEKPFDQLMPCLLHSINRHAAVYFILANIVTGVINMIIPTIDMQHAPTVLCYLFGYMLLNAFIVALLPSSTR